ncbi:hypothetical protein KDX06_33655 [Burkholderia vietnamiensis]|nr:hypothetical protein [Burkholderia vietnamiensis]
MYLGHGPSAYIWKDFGVNGQILSEDRLERNLRRQIRKFRPNVIVTGTSIFSYGEQQIWNIARALNIPSLALVDGWVKIRERFLSRNSRLVTPDRFGVVDSDTKRLLAKTCNVNPSRIGIIGHPHLEEVSINLLRARSIRCRQNIPTIAFFSTPIENNEAEPGINTARSLLTALQSDKPLRILFKPHPRENINPWRRWIEDAQLSGQLENIEVSLVSERSAFDILSHIDVAIGLPTSVLFEAAFSGIPTIVIEPEWWPIKNVAIVRYLSANILRDIDSVSQEISSLLEGGRHRGTSINMKLFENSNNLAARMILNSKRHHLKLR